MGARAMSERVRGREGRGMNRARMDGNISEI